MQRDGNRAQGIARAYEPGRDQPGEAAFQAQLQQYGRQQTEQRKANRGEINILEETESSLAMGLRAHMAQVVVATHLSDDTWGSLWRHQLRWARTIRLCRGGGYLGLPITHAGLWAAAAALAGFPWAGLSLLTLRLATALMVGWGVLGSRIASRWFWLAPIWDIWAFFLWLAGLFGHTVLWRGARLRGNRG